MRRMQRENANQYPVEHQIQLGNHLVLSVGEDRTIKVKKSVLLSFFSAGWLCFFETGALQPPPIFFANFFACPLRMGAALVC